MTMNVKRGFRNILKLIKSFFKAFHLNVKLTNILSHSKFHPIIGLNFYIPAIAFAWLDVWTSATCSIPTILLLALWSTIKNSILEYFKPSLDR